MLARVALPLAVLAVCWSATPLHAQGAPRTTTVLNDVPAGSTRMRLTLAARALQRGDTLRSEDIAIVDTSVVWRWATPPDTTRAAVGWIARRTIAIGEVLRFPAVSAPPVVHAGARVSLIYQDGPVRIVLTGVATNTAPIGAAVGVRIDPTRRLDGIAVAPNTVRLR